MELGLFTSSEVCQIIGLSRRQLQYWESTRLLGPTYKTRGGHGRYTFADLVAYRTAKQLLDAGISVQRIRKSIEKLRTLLPKVKRPLTELSLVATGDVILVLYEGTAFEAVSGQEWVIDIADLQREVHLWQERREEVGQFRRLQRVKSNKEGLIRSA